jgi:AcrR family transcriptional regulator
MLEKPLEEKIDRRKQRTRRMLRDALLALIVEKGYDDLSVQDITEKADLRRATFYLHYADKDELLATVLREIFDALVKELEALMLTADFTRLFSVDKVARRLGVAYESI